MHWEDTVGAVYALLGAASASAALAAVGFAAAGIALYLRRKRKA